MRLSPCVLVQPDGWARGEREGYGGPCDVTSLSLSLRYGGPRDVASLSLSANLHAEEGREVERALTRERSRKIPPNPTGTKKTRPGPEPTYP